MRHSAPDPRSSKIRIFLILCSFPIILVFLWYFFFATKYLPKQRTTIVFLTSPVEILSYEPQKDIWTVLTLPSEVQIAGTQGFGDYSIESLWKLAGTEGSAAAVLLGSLTDELGVPVQWYVGKKQELWSQKPKENTEFSFFLSKQGILSHIVKKYETSVSLPLHVALVAAYEKRDVGRLNRVVLSKGNGIQETTAKDGSTHLMFDREQFDQLEEDIFEDSRVRLEKLRISVLNTTTRPFLGSRVARILSKMGANVIQVGSDKTPIGICQMIGVEEALSSQTAVSVVDMFHCEKQKITEPGRADLVIKIGTDYERRFLPK